MKLPRIEWSAVLFASSLGCHALQEPAAGARMAVSGLADCVEGEQFGIEKHFAQLFVEFGIAAGFAADGAGGAADVAGRLFHAAAAENKVENLMDFDVVESTRTAGAGLRGRERLTWSWWRRAHRGEEWVNGFGSSVGHGWDS